MPDGAIVSKFNWVSLCDEVDKITNDTEFTEGDFEIVSSDNVRFKVPSYHLFAASAVFEGAQGLDSDTERSITLFDSTIETAEVVRLFLHLVVHGKIALEGYMPHVKELVLFLGKWDCERAKRHLLAKLENAVHRGAVQAHIAWLVGANADDPEICRIVLATYPDATWVAPKVQDGNLLWSTPGDSAWSPASWNRGFWEDAPKKYLFALARAYGKGDCSKLASEFERYIKVISEI
ncbi:hypothetical protein CC85DRAFT_289407 [Cutaneotrichosporon oleaginosum]|uniref:BTB domain-containing protein n=1 Tax=Cutaneotrichosporon oleaginosum TaxID=879819 RepID=A0A0J1ATA6_9TREE|nr:uncharacterized protein CC85DRAFT_289407 [Cutaneotrichosporon oleaginosum]KLT38554.1 hypothetical protein CC85DRAFT_289407 [Cutaneotrichosporon oleaginosum]TXT08476.1 hypothetical protein COLE_05400 [Cutaneotrichosporon oleaginosum]